MKSSRKNGKSSSELFRECFKDSQPLTAMELMNMLVVSRITISRHLKKNHALTSVNANGQYYILPEMAKFNRYGLAEINGKIFSRYGNLLKTIEYLVNDSRAGMSPLEIENLTGANVQSQCLIMYQKEKLSRKRYGKTYYYFSPERKKQEFQMLLRNPSKPHAGLDTVNEEPIKSLREVVKILATYIRNPNFSPKSIALSLSRRGIAVTTEKVREVFDRYDLAKKKP